MQYSETTDLDSALSGLDVLYMTRIQKERFDSEADYLRLKDSYILVPEKLKAAKKDLSILHPLPRVNEISVKVDSDPRAKYFEQALNGKYMRMALILKLLEDSTSGDFTNTGKLLRNVYKCENERCITSCEQEIEHVFKASEDEPDTYRCIYCEAKAK